jgi:hypothetical protein
MRLTDRKTLMRSVSLPTREIRSPVGRHRQPAEIPPHRREGHGLARLPGNQHVVDQGHREIGGHERGGRAGQGEHDAERGHSPVRLGEDEQPCERPPRGEAATGQGTIVVGTAAGGSAGDRFARLLRGPPGRQRDRGRGDLAAAGSLERVERVLEQVHPLRLRRREQPAGHHASMLRELDPSHRRAEMDVELRVVTQGPGARPGCRDGGGVGGGGGVCDQSAVGQRDPAVGKPQPAIEVESTGGKQLFAGVEPDHVAPREPRAPAGCVSGR